MAASDEIAATAARLVVEDGMDYASAKRKAARELGRRGGVLVDLAGLGLLDQRRRRLEPLAVLLGELAGARDEAGHAAVLRKIVTDLSAKCITITEAQVRAKMDELMAEAAAQVKAGA